MEEQFKVWKFTLCICIIVSAALFTAFSKQGDMQGYTSNTMLILEKMAKNTGSSSVNITEQRMQDNSGNRDHPVKPYEVFNSTHHITFRYPHNHGVGNAMMIYSSLYGLSRLHKMDPFVDIDHKSMLYNWFDLSIPLLKTKPATFDHPLVMSEGSTRFAMDKFFTMSTNSNIILDGTFATFKYFKHTFDELRRREFIFKPQILAKCQHRLLASVNGTLPANFTSEMCTYVAVHCRRGDFTSLKNYKIGHQPALESYLHKAVKYFRKSPQMCRLANSPCICFIVLGNDAKWNRKAMPNETDIVIMEPHKDAIVDLCILAQCNHTISTTGTFSWFAAFLANGHTTYQMPFLRPNSPAVKRFKKEDFLPEHWVPIEA